VAKRATMTFRDPPITQDQSPPDLPARVNAYLFAVGIKKQELYRIDEDLSIGSEDLRLIDDSQSTWHMARKVFLQPLTIW
jgi:hypothetical protein